MLAELRLAVGLLTIVPVGVAPLDAPGRASAYFPLVGLAIGGLLLGAASLPVAPAALATWLVLLVWVVVTGGLHLDGLADSCDGLLATVEPAHRRAIMHDPRAGAWAVIGVVLVLLGKWSALGTIVPLGLLAPPVVGRWAMVVAMAAFPTASSRGLAATFRHGLDWRAVAVATTITLAVVAGLSLLTTPLVWLLLPIGLALALSLGRWATQRLGGGLTGDVYGAICEVTELVCLLIVGGAVRV